MAENGGRGMKEKRYCKVCRKELPKGRTKYCSDECLYHKKYQNKPKQNKVCEYCNKTFKTNRNDARFCCKKCAGLYYTSSYKSRTKAKKEGRKLTHTTVYLVQKWYSENMDVKDICYQLDRPDEDIYKALKIRLSDVDYETMKEFMVENTHQRKRAVI